MSETNTVTETANTPETLLQEQRAGVIDQIHSHLAHVIDEGAGLADLMILRDVLSWALTNGGNVLTGIATTLNRDRSDAVWVRIDHSTAVERYARQLEAVDDAIDTRERTTLSTHGGAQIRAIVIEWLSTWSDIQLIEWWHLGLAVANNDSAATTPVESAIVKMGGSYALAYDGKRECTLDTLQTDLDETRNVSESSYPEDQSTDEDTPVTSKYRASFEEWLDTWCENDLESLYQLGHAVANHHGCATTPVEDFIRELGMAYFHISEGHGTGISIRDVQRMLDEAKEWFDDAVITARYMNKRYAKALAESAAA